MARKQSHIILEKNWLYLLSQKSWNHYKTHGEKTLPVQLRIDEMASNVEVQLYSEMRNCKFKPSIWWINTAKQQLTPSGIICEIQTCFENFATIKTRILKRLSNTEVHGLSKGNCHNIHFLNLFWMDMVMGSYQQNLLHMNTKLPIWQTFLRNLTKWKRHNKETMWHW